MEVRNSDIAEMCTVSLPAINKALKSGILIKNENGLIDTENEINAKYINRHQKKKPYKPKPPEKVEPVKDEVLSFASLKLIKAKKDIEKVEQDTIKVKLQNAKLKGENIPIDLVRDAFAQVFRNIGVSFKNGVEKVAIQFPTKHRSKIRKTLIDIVNESIEESIDHSMVLVDQISTDKYEL